MRRHECRSGAHECARHKGGKGRNHLLRKGARASKRPIANRPQDGILPHMLFKGEGDARGHQHCEVILGCLLVESARGTCGLGDGVGGVVRAAHQRAGFDVREAQFAGLGAEIGELFGSNVANDGQVLG